MQLLDKCIVCGSREIVPEMDVIDNQYGCQGRWKIFKCTKCMHKFLNPRPSMDDISSYYPTGKYYTHKAEAIPKEGRLMSIINQVHFKMHKDKPFLQYFVFSLLYSFFSKYTNILPPVSSNRKATLLDIGCGNGYLMARYERYGFEVWGQEISNEAGSVAKCITPRVYIGHLKDAPFPKHYFDVIIMNQVLEHIHYPAEFLLATKYFLKKNGTLIISVPNIDCYDAYLFKESWYAIQAPTHLSYFCPSSLEKVLNNSGLKVDRWAFSGMYKGYTRHQLLLNFKYLIINSKVLHNWKLWVLYLKIFKIIGHLIFLKPLLWLVHIRPKNFWSDRITCYASLKKK